MEIVPGTLTPSWQRFLTPLLLPVLHCVSAALNSPRSKNFNFFSSNSYLEILASVCKQHEKCSGKCQNKVIANIPHSSNISRSFPYYGQGKHSLALFTGSFFDALKDCQVSDPVHVTGYCHVSSRDSPWFHIRARTGKKVRRNDPSPGLWVYLWEFCPAGVSPSISASQREPPLHMSVSSEGCPFPQFNSKHRNSS